MILGSTGFLPTCRRKRLVARCPTGWRSRSCRSESTSVHPLLLDWAADTDLPVTIADVKLQLRILDDQYDALLNDIYIPGAVAWAEGEMKRSILAKVHYWVLSDFPRGKDQSIRLPRGKTQSVASIAYTAGNATSTLTGPTSGSPAGTSYREDLRGNDGGVLMPNYGSTWPDVDLESPTPVLITFTAGWTSAQVPADIKGALMMYCADRLDIVGASDLGPHSNLNAKDLLLSGYRLERWY